MKRRVLRIGLLLCTVSLAWLLLYHPESMITKDRFETLRIGMTQSEVEQILGGPARDECGQSVKIWVPRGDSLNSMRLDPEDATNGLLFREDRPAATTPGSIFIAADFPEGGHELIWLSESVLIAVLLDKDGRLVEKHVSDVHVLERPTPLDWLRAKF